jgi:hypothetical protein
VPTPVIPTTITLDDLTGWRDRLINARLTGIKVIRDALKTEVEYKTDAEMERALASATEMIVAMTAAPVTTIRFRTSKGLGPLDYRRFGGGWY